MPRATPFDLVFQPAAATSFPRIAASLASAGLDPADRDAFLMDREVITLLRDLRPDEGLGEAMDQMVALVHHAYLTWAAGGVTIPIGRETAEELLDQVADCRTRGHQIRIKVGEGFVVRQGERLGYQS